ncbi:hypothetical protein [Tenacibaculum agarivorans]|uniref:hypothetical protein n=1 Tax=Tenacibaculum agarivorans TaxID=1908389 RepID=UPI00094B80E8|nr:hypothetical protein [Tenacibaculum agarivorans]
MGGSGSIQPILDNNKNLLRKKSLFRDLKHEITGDYNTNLKFKEVDTEELEKIKESIRVKAKRDEKRTVLVSFLICVVSAAFLYLLLHDFSIDFKLFARRI